MKAVCRLAMLLLLALAPALRAEPAWTRTGNCQACHTDAYPGILAVIGNDGMFDPDGATGPLAPLKVFRAQRGLNEKNLSLQVGGLAAGDTYAVALLRASQPGVVNSSQLVCTPDCAWTDWVAGVDHVYSEPARKYAWGSGPPAFNFQVDIPSTAAYDCYDLVFAVAGVRKATGRPFYSEEHFYLSVAPPNWAPAVAITSPANNATFTWPLDLTISATASDPDGSVARVEFYAGTAKVGEDATSPYDCVWTGVPGGAHLLTARAIDDAGAVTVSALVSISVSLPPPVPGDFDHDGDVDQSDFAHGQFCLTGTGVAQILPACLDARLDTDNDVDQDDLSILMGCMSGADVAGRPNCAG